MPACLACCACLLCLTPGRRQPCGLFGFTSYACCSLTCLHLSPTCTHPSSSQDLDDDCGEVAETKSRYVVAELPVRLPVLRPVLDKPNPKLGVGE